MKLIVGLGNPGFQYRATRHNIGFMVLDKIASRYRIRMKTRLFHALCGRGRVGDEEILLAKPLTYMNLSGKAIFEMKEREGMSFQDLLVIMDDVELELGHIRLRPRGSSGGHRGLRSIIEELGTEEYPRLRVGVGPQKREGLLRDYVLSPFKRSDKRLLGDSIEKSCRCVETWIEEGIEVAMSRFNS